MVTPHARALVPDLEMKKGIPEPARWAAGPVWVRSRAVGMKGFCFCAITLFGYIAYVTGLIVGVLLESCLFWKRLMDNPILTLFRFSSQHAQLCRHVYVTR